MPRLIHFEIPADDPERAAKFYTAVFGWEIKKLEGPVPYWLIDTKVKDVPATNGALTKRENAISGQGIFAYICTMDVPSADEYASKIEKAGGQIVQPKMPIMGVGWLVYAKDTEGNMFGILQADTEAK